MQREGEPQAPSMQHVSIHATPCTLAGWMQHAPQRRCAAACRLPARQAGRHALAEALCSIHTAACMLAGCQAATCPHLLHERLACRQAGAGRGSCARLQFIGQIFNGWIAAVAGAAAVGACARRQAGLGCCIAGGTGGDLPQATQLKHVLPVGRGDERRGDVLFSVRGSVPSKNNIAAKKRESSSTNRTCYCIAPQDRMLI